MEESERVAEGKKEMKERRFEGDAEKEVESRVGRG